MFVMLTAMTNRTQVVVDNAVSDIESGSKKIGHHGKMFCALRLVGFGIAKNVDDAFDILESKKHTGYTEMFENEFKSHVVDILIARESMRKISPEKYSRLMESLKRRGYFFVVEDVPLRIIEESSNSVCKSLNMPINRALKYLPKGSFINPFESEDQGFREMDLISEMYGE